LDDSGTTAMYGIAHNVTQAMIAAVVRHVLTIDVTTTVVAVMATLKAFQILHKLHNSFCYVSYVEF